MSARENIYELLQETTDYSPINCRDASDRIYKEVRAEVLAQVGKYLVEIYGTNGKFIEAEPLAVNIGKWLQRGALWEEEP